jgi:hypothetical protein
MAGALSLLTFLSCFLFGSGKTALAATIGIDSEFPFVKIVRLKMFSIWQSLSMTCKLNASLFVLQITAQTTIGLSESTKCAMITKVWFCCTLVCWDDVLDMVIYDL